MVVCKCVFLDGKEVEITVEKDAKGSDLFESICKYLGLEHRDPFGIVFRGGVGPSPYNWWVRMDKTLKGQIPGKCKVWEFAFIVKYYPKTLAGMPEDIARFHVIMQIRQDLLTGRLRSAAHTMAHLCSYWLQAQYGDWASRHVDLQLADAFRYVQKGEEEANKVEGKCDIVFEEQMMQIHQTHKGMTARDADFRFIRLASSLPGYGIHYYPAYLPRQQQQPQSPGRRLLSLSSQKDVTEERGEKLTIGIGPLGVHQYKKRGNEIVYTWKSMRAVSFKRNKIVLKMQGSLRQNVSLDAQVSSEDTKNQRNIVKEYSLDDMYQTKIIWQALIEYHVFFRVADQKGLKGEERKRLINSLRIKRTIPMVGEKKAQRSPFSQSTKVSPRSASHFEYELPNPAAQSTNTEEPASTLRRQNSIQQHPRPSSPRPVSRKVQMSKSTQGEKEKRLSSSHTAREQVGGDGIDDTSGIRRDTRQKEGTVKSSVTTPASFASTPRSGVFVFPRNPSTKASTSGEEILEVVSDTTDNTDVLCSPNILDKTFSYSEDDGINNIGYWQEGLPRSRSNTPGARDSTKSKSPQQEYVEGENRRVDTSPFVIPAEILMEDLKDSKNSRAQGGYRSSSSSDFPMELDYVRKPRQFLSHARSTNLIDERSRETRTNTSTFREDKRAQSMHALHTNLKDRDRRTSPDRSTSPKRERLSSPRRRREVEGVVQSRRQRAEKRGYSDRAYSESRIAHKENADTSIGGGAKKTSAMPLRSATAAKRKPPVPRRRNITSWSHGDDYRDMIHEPNGAKDGSPKRPSRKENTIPKLPMFTRSVV